MIPRTSRRRFLRAAIAGTTVGIAGHAFSSAEVSRAIETPDADASLPSAVRLQSMTEALQQPVAIAFAPDADRRYIVERDGRVLVHEAVGLLDEAFLDLRDSIVTEIEQGLLGIALHPNFEENRRLYLRYSAPRRPEMRVDYTHRFVLSEFEAIEDGRRATWNSERVVLEIPQLSAHHNAGDVAFGPDGYLYVPVGDTAHRRYAQDVTNALYGGVLRIDVDEWSTDYAYSVPEDNPLVGQAGLDEYYAWGMRNPWRVSFDGDDFFVADVGQSSYEEVNLVEKGGNYGWDVKEGTHCFKAEDCPDRTPANVHGGETLVDPIIEYPHGEGPVSGSSVIGGFVYRGSILPELDGVYLFGDLIARGRIFAATRPDGPGLWPTAPVEISGAGAALRQIFSFGRDPSGEVFVLGTGPDGGGLYKIVPASRSAIRQR